MARPKEFESEAALKRTPSESSLSTYEEARQQTRWCRPWELGVKAYVTHSATSGGSIWKLCNITRPRALATNFVLLAPPHPR